MKAKRRAPYSLRLRLSATKEAYHSARHRCLSPSDKGWARYGGRSIKFLFNSFVEFVDALKTPSNPTGLKPKRGLSLDRYPNPDGHYENGNIRWATAKQQARNKSGSPSGEPASPASRFRPSRGKRITTAHRKAMRGRRMW